MNSHDVEDCEMQAAAKVVWMSGCRQGGLHELPQPLLSRQLTIMLGT